MEKLVIHAEKREVTGKKVGVLRREGKLPGVIYGHNFNALPVLMDLKDASKVLLQSTASTIINIELDGKEHAALVREKQKDYLRNLFIHVDFQAVSLSEKLRAKVSIELTGVAPAIRNFNGVVVEGVTSINVEALPGDLPERFVVDVTHLENIGDAIYLKDLNIPAAVQLLDSPDELVVLITNPAAEEVEEVVAAETGAEPEVIEKGKKEEEETKE
jgi:large subunit ribosomal protein L25